MPRHASSPVMHATSSIGIKDAQNEIIDTFSFLEDWSTRYEYIIDLGKNLPAFPSEKQVDANLLHGCQSQVWITYDVKESDIFYQATSDSAIVRGLIALLLMVYSGRNSEDIVRSSPDFLKKIQLSEHLSPTRSNGLYAMLAKIKEIAQKQMCD